VNEITDRGRPVALLTPIPEGSPLERMRAAGDVENAAADLEDLPEPLILPALVFDASYQGESGGEPHFSEFPSARVEDIRRAVDFVSGGRPVGYSRLVPVSSR
jgi:hypothetical protein